MRLSSALALTGQTFLSEALSIRSQSDGGLSILSMNNLDQDPVPGSAAVLVHGADNYDAATKHCKELNEELWIYDPDAFAAGVASALAHQVYAGNHEPEALFWIAAKASCGCSALTVDGELKEVPCKKDLPALCTQSAPVSWAGQEDTSAEFQITQQIGDLALTGYRDFFAWKFLGVRYATETLRFEYSQPLRGANGNASALHYGSACLQAPAEVPDGGSDDCLFVNIWTPYVPPAKGSFKKALKPVQVYFHGGGFVSGTANNLQADGTNFASRADVVVVAVNYRVGNAGMIAFDDGIHNGNIGIGDQVTALQWISENVAYFGGDPGLITIAGESAGAMSARYMMTTPLAQGLFQQALLRSDGGGGLNAGFGNFMSIEQSYQVFTVPLLDAAGCSDAEDQFVCMQELDGSTLAMLSPTAMWPVVDGTILTVPHTPLNGTDPGYARDIPVMASVTAEEGGVYVSLLSQALGLPNWGVISTLEEFAAVLSMHGVDASPIIDNYELFGLDPASPTREQIENALERYISLTSFICSSRAQMYSASLHGAFETVYGFQFNRTYSGPFFTNERCDATPTDEFPAGDPSMDYWRCHGGDQLVSWGNIIRSTLPDRDGLDVPYSRLVIDYLAAFIYTGNPNPDQEYLALRGYDSSLDLVRQMGVWTPVDPESPEWMILSMNGGMEAFPDDHMCALLGQPLDWWET